MLEFGRSEVIVPTAFVLLLLSGLTFWVQGAEIFVGTVKTAQGDAFVRRGADTLPTREGMHLQLNDILQTSSDGRLALILKDGTRISLGPNAELTIDRFVYQPVEGKFDLLLRLGRGALVYLSGKIAQFSPKSVSIETPVGIIGLRGTNVALSIEGG
jgi:hypothetical protein